MNLLNKIFRRKKDIKSIFPNQKHIIEPAFKVGGVQYYQFSDIFQIPYERGLMALAIYEEVRMRCTREYLQKHVEACRALLHDTKIDIYKLNLINEQLNDRLNLAFDAEHLYKLASVVFFDEKENPALYEADYCNRKIEFWKQNKDLTAFFLQKPLLELIPFLKDVDFDLQTYSEVVEKTNKIHSAVLQAATSKIT